LNMISGFVFTITRHSETVKESAPKRALAS
jgi:hypothetical protein